MRIVVDKDRCIGSGQCVLTQPEVFDQGEDDGLVVLLTEVPSSEAEASVHDAVRLCPSQALSVEEN